MIGRKSDEELRAEILEYREEARQLEREAARAGGYRSEAAGLVDKLCDEAAQRFALLAGKPGNAIGVNFEELARLHAASSPDFRKRLHEGIAATPVGLFAGEDRKAHDANLEKLTKAIAEREAELRRREARRAELEQQLAQVGAGEEAA